MVFFYQLIILASHVTGFYLLVLRCYNISMMTSTKFLFQLLDSASGQPYKGTSTDSVSLPPGADVADFQKLVYNENSKILTDFVPSQLIVYKYEGIFDRRNLTSVDEGKEEQGVWWRCHRVYLKK